MEDGVSAGEAHIEKLEKLESSLRKLRLYS